MSFAHLHTHSHFSLLGALPHIHDLVAQAKAAGAPALAITDNGNMYAAIDFYKECASEGIKPILGVDAYLASSENKVEGTHLGADHKTPRLVLLAKNEGGYKNLLQLITRGNLENQVLAPGKPLLTRELFKAHGNGLIAIAPSREGEIALALSRRDFERARRVLEEYQTLFGIEDVYLEITHHPEITGHEELMGTIQKFAKENNVPLVAAHDIFYIAGDDAQAWNTLRAIENRGRDDGNLSGDDEENFSFPKPGEMEEWFKDTPEALENTLKIAQKINLKLTLGSWLFPRFPLPEGSTYEIELRKKIEAGLHLRGMEESPEIRERIEYEYTIITDKGFAPYFLVVADLLRFARESGILTTTRGSAAGSLAAYLTFITNVDPIEYKLPFERFLNPERPKAPDIDMDFADNRRDEVIEYARRMYGNEQVAQIGTFGTMLARGVVRDVARALGKPYGLGDAISKEIPMGSQGFPMTLDRALEISEDLAKMYKKDPEVREIIDLGKKIEGCARHISVHAAGVVIGRDPLVTLGPLQRDPKGGKIITQYDMYAVEEVGLLKFDFLGIRNLAILADAVQIVERTKGLKVDIENIPLDDTETFQMLARGETEGTFQMNGAGMTRALKELRPTTIHDINAMVALYRPGPMEMIPTYIERKHNPKLVDYLDPRMAEILDRSYGVITYQDDVLMIAVKLAGYSWLEADGLRKAMGKKIPAEMEAQRIKLIEGAIKGGMIKQKAETLWKLIEPFAAYGFNKAHAASYGKVAYQTAYMKAHYPVEYMTAILSAESGDIDTVGIIVAECKRMGIVVLPPDINESFSDFTALPAPVTSSAALRGPSDSFVVIPGTSAESASPRLAFDATGAGTERTFGEKGSIRFGLSTIKNFGEGVGASIIAERKQNGPFVSLSDFLRRISDRNLNKKSLEALAQCGALDRFGERGGMLAHTERMLDYHKGFAQADANQDSLFSLMGDTKAADLVLPPSPPTPIETKLAWEKELLGLYVSGHPLDKHKNILSKRSMDIKTLITSLRPGMTGVVSGIVEDMKIILTKNGDQMAFIRMADASGSLETVIFPKILVQFKELLKANECLSIKGRLNSRNGEMSMIAEAVKAL